MVVSTDPQREQVVKLIEEKTKIEKKIADLGLVLQTVRKIKIYLTSEIDLEFHNFSEQSWIQRATGWCWRLSQKWHRCSFCALSSHANHLFAKWSQGAHQVDWSWIGKIFQGVQGNAYINEAPSWNTWCINVFKQSPSSWASDPDRLCESRYTWKSCWRSWHSSSRSNHCFRHHHLQQLQGSRPNRRAREELPKPTSTRQSQARQQIWRVDSGAQSLAWSWTSRLQCRSIRLNSNMNQLVWFKLLNIYWILHMVSKHIKFGIE